MEVMKTKGKMLLSVCLTSRRSPVRAWDRPPITLSFQPAIFPAVSFSSPPERLIVASSGQVLTSSAEGA